MLVRHVLDEESDVFVFVEEPGEGSLALAFGVGAADVEQDGKRPQRELADVELQVSPIVMDVADGERSVDEMVQGLALAQTNFLQNSTSSSEIISAYRASSDMLRLAMLM
jgi:hypothetical protein